MAMTQQARPSCTPCPCRSHLLTSVFGQATEKHPQAVSGHYFSPFVWLGQPVACHHLVQAMLFHDLGHGHGHDHDPGHGRPRAPPAATRLRLRWEGDFIGDFLQHFVTASARLFTASVSASSDNLILVPLASKGTGNSLSLIITSHTATTSFSSPCFAASACSCALTGFVTMLGAETPAIPTTAFTCFTTAAYQLPS